MDKDGDHPLSLAMSLNYLITPLEILEKPNRKLSEFEQGTRGNSKKLEVSFLFKIFINSAALFFEHDWGIHV